VIWLVYLLLLLGVVTFVTQVVRGVAAQRRARQPKPGWHEDLP
jgi:hypothetical protein